MSYGHTNWRRRHEGPHTAFVSHSPKREDDTARAIRRAGFSPELDWGLVFKTQIGVLCTGLAQRQKIEEAIKNVPTARLLISCH